MTGELESIRRKHGLPAVSVALLRDGKIELAVAVGQRKAGAAEAVRARDAFPLGSISKVMTATLVAILVDQGHMRWEETMAEAFPELLSTMNPTYRRVNLLELFAHRSGMAYYPGNVTAQQINARSPTIVGQRYEYTRAALTDPPQAPPGTKTIYSGGANIAATIAERRLGRSYEELMRAYVFEPLGLHCHFGGASRPDAVDGPWNHRLENGRFVPVRPEGQPPPPNVPHASSTPVGGVVCSASDLALFLGEHLPRNSRRRGLLSERALEILHAHVEGGQFAPGFLYDPQSWLGAGVLWHYGSNGTYLAASHVVPDRNFAIVALTNGSGPPADKGIDETNKLLVRWANYTEE